MVFSSLAGSGWPEAGRTPPASSRVSQQRESRALPLSFSFGGTSFWSSSYITGHLSLVCLPGFLFSSLRLNLWSASLPYQPLNNHNNSDDSKGYLYTDGFSNLHLQKEFLHGTLDSWSHFTSLRRCLILISHLPEPCRILFADSQSCSYPRLPYLSKHRCPATMSRIQILGVMLDLSFFFTFYIQLIGSFQ